MDEVLLFAGTTEGRVLAEKLALERIPVTVCVATEYGREMLPTGENITVLTGRLNEGQIEQLLMQNHFFCAVDATHPYAAVVTENLRLACGRAKVPYLRLLRGRAKSEHENVICMADASEAACYLAGVPGNVLLTTGSKELDVFAECVESERLFVRMLPTQEALEKCHRLGIAASHLCCMQGPFSQELNQALLTQWKIHILVTKESGRAGGFEEKLRAANAVGVQALVIGRPQQVPGYPQQEIFKKLKTQWQLKMGGTEKG